MLEELKQIDTSVIDHLIEIKEQRENLKKRLSRLEQKKEQISDFVYQRVRRDYQSQQTALEQKAAPLVDQARNQYGKLTAVLRKLEDVAQTTQFDEEELEVRHSLGEFDEDEFKSRVAKIRTRLKAQKRDLAEITEVKEKFVAAFDSEEELAEGGLPPAAKVAPLRPKEEAAPGPQEVASPRPKTVAAPMPEEVAATRPDEQSAAEVVAAPKEEAAAAAAESSPRTPTAARTQLLPIARLVPLEGDCEGSEILVQPITTLGRGPDNQVQIDETSVSRHHAQITLEVEGFVIRDLDSQNGSFVNGEPIKEHLLVDGDRIQIGTARFIFRPS